MKGESLPTMLKKPFKESYAPVEDLAYPWWLVGFRGWQRRRPVRSTPGEGGLEKGAAKPGDILDALNMNFLHSWGQEWLDPIHPTFLGVFVWYYGAKITDSRNVIGSEPCLTNGFLTSWPLTVSLEELATTEMSCNLSIIQLSGKTYYIYIYYIYI